MSLNAPSLLVVDDDATLRSTLESVLDPLGYRIVTAATPEDACALLAVAPFDAVLLDIRMPTMSGPALYLAMLNRWPYLTGRIAFMSADADAPDVRPWLDTHGCAVFRKPFSLTQVTQWLDAFAVTIMWRQRRTGS